MDPNFPLHRFIMNKILQKLKPVKWIRSEDFCRKPRFTFIAKAVLYGHKVHHLLHACALYEFRMAKLGV